MRLKLVLHYSNKRELKWNHLVRLKHLKPKLKKLLTEEIWVSQSILLENLVNFVEGEIDIIFEQNFGKQ